MMQNPLLSYPALSHFLELRHHSPFAAAAAAAAAAGSSPPPPAPQPAAGASAAGVVTAAPPPVQQQQPPPPAPPLFVYSRPPASSAAAGKSFTIDAILGLDGAHTKEPRATNLSVVNAAGGRPGFAGTGCRRPTEKVCGGGSAGGVPGGECGVSVGGSKKPAKSKRVRTIFTPEQLERLEAEFERQQYMVGPERLYLAHALQLTEAQVKVWFQNRRIKWRKQHLEMQQQRLAALKQQQQLQQHHLEMEDSEGDSNSGDEAPSTSVLQPAPGPPPPPPLSTAALPPPVSAAALSLPCFPSSAGE